MGLLPERPSTARTLTISAVAGGAATGLAVQLRHRRQISRDEDYTQLTVPLRGRPFNVTSADGTRLHAEAFGADRGPTVVLVHGWTEQLRLWGPVIKLLAARGLRVVAYDLRGHGASGPAVEQDYALERFGEDVEAVLAAAVAESGPADGRATVVGHSLGAMSIAAWAQHHEVGTHGRAAALVNTGLGDLGKGHLLFGELAKWLNHPMASRAFLGSRARIPSFSTPLQQAVIRYAAFGPTATPGQVAFYERMLVSCPADVRAACGVAMSDMDLWEAVASLTIPTLVVAGSADRLTPPAYARRIAEALPDLAGLIELPQTGHMAPLERPGELGAALVALVDRVSPGP